MILLLGVLSLVGLVRGIGVSQRPLPYLNDGYCPRPQEEIEADERMALSIQRCLAKGPYQRPHLRILQIEPLTEMRLIQWPNGQAEYISTLEFHARNL